MVAPRILASVVDAAEVSLKPIESPSGSNPRPWNGRGMRGEFPEQAVSHANRGCGYTSAQLSRSPESLTKNSHTYFTMIA